MPPVIIDTHVHVVAGDPDRYPVAATPPDWPVVTGADLLSQMDGGGIDRAMLVQSFFTYGFDNSYALDCADAAPDRFGVVVVIDQTEPGAADLLSHLVLDRGVGGVRLMPKGMPEGVLWDPRTFPVWERAGELGIPVLVAAEIQHVPGMPAVLERFPEVTVCFEHMWGIEIDRPPFPRLRPVVELASFPNVHLKLAPNNAFAARDAEVPPRELYDHLREHFGPRRLMFGTNYPAHPARFGSYADRVEVMREDLSYLEPGDRDAFFGENAERLWPARDQPTDAPER